MLKIAVHKFTSCDGCQLAFLNSGELLLALAQQVEITHFSEAGFLDLNSFVDISFVEGSITTPDDLERIKKIRAQSQYVITIGACATAGGIQALRNFADAKDWIASIYATPQTISALATSTAISQHIKVDWEIWGCPVNTHQIFDVVKSLLAKATPRIKRDAVCIECKRKNNVCVLVTKKSLCMGPITQTGCGALCPSIERPCYGCYGPAEKINSHSLVNQFKILGGDEEKIKRQFKHINNQVVKL